MKNKFKILLAAGIIASAMFTACTSEINIKLNENNTIDVKFTGEAGIAFEQLIRSATGSKDGQIVFDTQDITYELSKNGFSNVKAVSKNGSDLTVTMKETSKKSPLYKADILDTKNGKLTATLSPQKLIDFYNSSDDQIVMFLDMMLSPVFNDEVMSEEEYIETMASFYGDKAAKEISDSNFKVILENPDGKKSIFNIPMKKLLTLDEVIVFKN